MGSQARYLFDPSWEGEERRLRGGERAWDPITARHLDAIGPAPGWACLELGAGAGSIARLLAERVGPGGRVVATDVDTRFLAGLAGPGVEVRRHDVTRDELPAAAFDLVHARLVLMHLPERADVLRRLVEALRPGGWLLVEELDWLTGTTAPGAGAVSRLIRAHCRLLAAAGADPRYGRKLPAALARLGLERVTAEGAVRLGAGGPVATAPYRLAVEQQRDRLLDLGLLTEAEVERALAAMDDRSLTFLSPMLVSARGRRPGAGART